jgi:hypothetical protein
MHMQSTHTVTHMHTYNNQPAGECVLDPTSIPTPSTSTPPPEASWRALSCSQPPTITSDESTMSARPPTGLRERERRKVGKGGEKRREMVSGLGGRQGRVRRSEEKVCKACCVCSGKPGPAPPAANAVMCAGKKIPCGFDRVSTYHQKITARTRLEIWARSVRAERARDDKS